MKSLCASAYMDKRRKYGPHPWCIVSVRDRRKEEDLVKQIEERMIRKNGRCSVIEPR